MSRLGKKPIELPQGVTVSVSDHQILIKGPKGELKWVLPSEFGVELNEKYLSIVPSGNMKKNTKAIWGLARQHLANMIRGVSVGFEKRLEFEGIGYRVEVLGRELVLSVGFTHPVKLVIPEGISVSVVKNVITVSGFDRVAVGQFAANIRKIRPPEPYKGTGIRYAGEIIRKKAGKKFAGATAT